MRISGGDARGVKLKVPPGARPASERVRQAVFSSLAARVPDARVLDLYCGSGAYGLEALSRGAGEATFVDREAKAIEACRANVEAAGFRSYAHIRKAEAQGYLQRRAAADGPFDLIFVDPPYSRSDQAQRLLDRLPPALSPQGRVVLETRWGPAPAHPPPGLVVEADRRYGDTRVLTFRWGEK